MKESYFLEKMKLTFLKPSKTVILLMLQKIWKYSTGLMTSQTIRKFSYKCLFSVTNSIRMINDKYQNCFNFIFQPVSTNHNIH